MAYTAPKTYAVGDVLTASDMNTYQRDNIIALYNMVQFIPLTTPLSSTNWDGDGYSTTAKTKIDLSAVFSVPAGVSAVLVLLQIRDSASSTSEVGMGFAPNDTADQYSFFQSLRGVGNNYSEYVTVTIPCDANGDIYYQIAASGNSTMDVWLTIWGYWSTT